MKSLLAETMSILEDYGKNSNDVLWVLNNQYKTSWSDFAKLADEFYDNGFGGTEVDENLIILGRDFWLERHEYDGSEWWEYKSIKNFKSRQTKEFTKKDIFTRGRYDY